MKQLIAYLFLLFLSIPGLFAQTTPNDMVSNKMYASPASLGVRFFLNDFQTAQLIRSTSLSMVLRNKQFGQVSNMAPGIGITYFKGLFNHIDFAGSLMGSFVNMQTGNSSSGSSSDNSFLLEGDASLNLKMLTDRYWVDPYLIVGVGASQYKGTYSAFIPLGGGIKVNFFDEAALFFTTQYHIPVNTETSNYHFVYSIGVSGIIGQKKTKE